MLNRYIYFLEKTLKDTQDIQVKKHIQGHLYANTATSYGSTLFEHKPTSLKGGPKKYQRK